MSESDGSSGHKGPVNEGTDTSPDVLQRRVVELEAQLLEQDHRFFRVLYNVIVTRRDFPRGDPRRRATIMALIYAFLSARTATTITISIIAILGLVLAFQANILLNRQNDKIEIQNQLAEASRRSALAFELTSINEAIAQTVREQRAEGQIDIDQTLVGRIVAISRALKPYYFLDFSRQGDAANKKADRQAGVSGLLEQVARYFDQSLVSEKPLIHRPLSPERGQLLIMLINSKISNLSEVFAAGADFSSADLRGVRLTDINLGGALLRDADFSRARLENVDLDGELIDGADFTAAYLKRTTLYRSFQENTGYATQLNFERTLLEDVTLKNVTINNSRFANMSLTGLKFEDGRISYNSYRNVAVCRIRDEVKMTEDTAPEGPVHVLDYVTREFSPANLTPGNREPKLLKELKFLAELCKSDAAPAYYLLWDIGEQYRDLRGDRHWANLSELYEDFFVWDRLMFSSVTRRNLPLDKKQIRTPVLVIH